MTAWQPDSLTDKRKGRKGTREYVPTEVFLVSLAAPYKKRLPMPDLPPTLRL